MLWLAMLFPDFPLQIHCRGMDDIVPLAVTRNAPPHRIIAATPCARAHGIEAGQNVATALAMLPSLKLFAQTPDLEARQLRELAVWAGAFAPRICIDPPDGILLEVASCLKLFGGLESLMSALNNGLAEQGYSSLLACAPTPLAARWLARQQLPGSSPGVQLASDLRPMLDTLPLACLSDGCDIDRASLELLAGLGLRTLGEVRTLPASGLARRQAHFVVDTLARAYGERPDLREEFVAPPTYTAQLSLTVPTINVEPLMFASSRLIAGLTSWLQARQSGIDHLQLGLLHQREHTTVIDILTGSPCRDETQLKLLTREKLHALKLMSPVEGLSLNAAFPRPLAARSDDLFGDHATARENALLLLNRLQARLGNDCVRMISPVADRRPERAWKWTSPRIKTDPFSTQAAAKLQVGTARPLMLLDSPQPIDSPQTLKLLHGPERIEQGWWDGNDIRRDYYIANTTDGALWWVFRNLTPPCGWYLQGFFG